MNLYNRIGRDIEETIYLVYELNNVKLNITIEKKVENEDIIKSEILFLGISQKESLQFQKFQINSLEDLFTDTMELYVELETLEQKYRNGIIKNIIAKRLLKKAAKKSLKLYVKDNIFEDENIYKKIKDISKRDNKDFISTLMIELDKSTNIIGNLAYMKEEKFSNTISELKNLIFKPSLKQEILENSKVDLFDEVRSTIPSDEISEYIELNFKKKDEGEQI